MCHKAHGGLSTDTSTSRCTDISAEQLNLVQMGIRNIGLHQVATTIPLW